jgi:ribosomal protein S18 acetylase RimI-like enzyme
MPQSTTSEPRGKSELTSPRRVLRGLLSRLGRVGIAIKPYLMVREGAASTAATITLDPRFSAGFIGPDDTPELVRVEPGITAEQCIDRFQRGLLCYAVKDGSRIVAKMWCDLEELNFPPSVRKLGTQEAYLFNAYTDPTVRGHSLAPYMRQQCYAALQARGRNSFYSYSDYFNTASRRFKKKLGAIEESLFVHVNLFGVFSRTFTLRRYSTHD